jgi:hypothetical protein
MLYFHCVVGWLGLSQVLSSADWIREQPHTHVDETGWPVKGVKEWLWSFSGAGYAL